MKVSGRTAVIGLVLASVAVTLLLGLARSAVERGALSPSATPTASDSLGPSSAAPTFSPHVTATPLASGPSTVVPAPQSARAVPGVNYAARLLAPCVLLIDFDGAFWAAPPGFTLFQPTQPSTVRLLGTGEVVIRTGAGQEVTLRRLAGPATIPPCP
jgi:hypothetical protein